MLIDTCEKKEGGYSKLALFSVCLFSGYSKTSDSANQVANMITMSIIWPLLLLVYLLGMGDWTIL